MEITGFKDRNSSAILLLDAVNFNGDVFEVYPDHITQGFCIGNDNDEEYALVDVHEQCEVIMTDFRLKELFEKVSPMSFEDGRQYILSLYPNVNEHSNADYTCFSDSSKKNEGLYDHNFVFNDDLILTFTTVCVRTDEDEIIDYDSGYWNIHGER